MACATGKESLPVERKARLDALGLVWDPYVAQWEEGFGHLQAFVAEYGHCRVPRKHVTADGFRLGQWFSHQRAAKVSMPAERKGRLDAPGFVWDPYAAQWEEGIRHLQAFVQEYGHCSVPNKHRTADGYRLGGWVGVQRREQDSMTAQRKARLDALGFEWDASKRRPAAE
jgi:hypothetical protein